MNRSVQTRNRWLRSGAPLVSVALLASVGVALTTVLATPASAATVLADDFEDGDSAGWVTSGGRWSVITDGSRVLRQSGTSANARATAGDLAWTDYEVTARVKPTPFAGRRGAVGLRARVSSDTSYYYLQLRPDDTVELGKVVRGRSTVLATAAVSDSAGTWHSMALATRGTTLTGRVDSVSLTRATHRSRLGASA